MGQTLSLDSLGSRLHTEHRPFLSTLLKIFRNDRKASSELPQNPGAGVQRKPRASAEKAVRDLQAWSRWPFLRVFLLISRQSSNELVNFYQIHYPALTDGNAPGLPASMIGVWRDIMQRLLPSRKVTIVSGPGHPLLLEDVGEETEIKDTLLAMHGDEIQARNRMLAWVLGRREARLWISDHRRHVITRGLIWLAKNRGFSSDHDQLEYAAAILNVLRPFDFYTRMRQETLHLAGVPPATVETLVQEFVRHHPNEPLQQVAIIYLGLQSFYKSADDFAQATHKALSIAKMGRGIEDIHAALLSSLPEAERKRWINESDLSPLAAHRMLSLVSGAESLSYLAFNPTLVTDQPDFSMEDEIDGVLKQIGNLAAKAVAQEVEEGALAPEMAAQAVRHMRGSLLCQLLAEKLQQITWAGHVSEDNGRLRQLALEVQLLHVSLADRFGLEDMRMDLLEAVMLATHPEDHQRIHSELEQALGLPVERIDSFLEDTGRKLQRLSKDLHEPFQVIPHRKSFWSIHQRQDPVLNQENLLVIQVIVESPKELRRIGNLERFIGQPRTNASGHRAMRSHWKGEEQTERTVWIDVDDPRDASRKIQVELQMLTQEGYRQFLYGQRSLAKDDPAWVVRLQKRADRIAFDSKGVDKHWNLLFDRRDSDFQTTGRLEPDLDNNLERVCEPLEAFVFPRMAVNSEGPRTLRFPAQANIADFLLHPSVGNNPIESPVVRSGSSGRVLPPEERLEDGHILFVNSQDGTQALNRSSKAYAGLKTPRATLLMRALSPRQGLVRNSRLKEWLSFGAVTLTQRFGTLDEVFEKEVLLPTAGRLGFANVSELVSALGAEVIGMDAIENRYNARYPSVTCELAEEEDRYRVTVTLEEDRIGFLDEVRRTIKQLGLRTIGPLELPESASGEAKILFDIAKPLPSNRLISDLEDEITRLRRPHGQDQPARDAKRRLVELEIYESPEVLDTLSHKLGEKGFNIVALKPKGGLPNRRYELILSGPDSLSQPQPKISADLMRLMKPLDGILSCKVMDLDQFVKLQVHWERDAGESDYLLTITSEEGHPDLLPHAVEAATKMGWNLLSPLSQRLEVNPNSTVLKVRQPAGEPLRIDALARELRDLRLPRDTPIEIPGARFLLHFFLLDKPGSLNQVMQYFRSNGICLLGIQDEPLQAGEQHGWFDMEIVVPAERSPVTALGLRKALSTLTLKESSEKIVGPAEVIGLTMNGATARRVNEILVDEIRRLPAPESEKKVFDFTPVSGEEEGMVNEDIIALVQKAIAQAKESTGDPQRPHRDRWPLVYPQTRKAEGNIPSVIHLLRSAQRAVAKNGQRSYMTVNETILHDAIEDFRKNVWRYIETYLQQLANRVQKGRKPLPPEEFDRVPRLFGVYFPTAEEDFKKAVVSIQSDPSARTLSEHLEILKNPVERIATDYLVKQIRSTFTTYPDRMVKGLRVLTVEEIYAKYARNYMDRNAQYEIDAKLTEQADNYENLVNMTHATKILSRGIRHLLPQVIFPFPRSVASHVLSRQDYLSKLVEETLHWNVEFFLPLEGGENLVEAQLDLLNTVESFFTWIKDRHNKHMVPPEILDQGAGHPFLQRLQQFADQVRADLHSPAEVPVHLQELNESA